MGSSSRRRLGGNARVLRKKKVKMSKKSMSAGSASGEVAAAPFAVTKTKGVRLRLKKVSSRVSSRGRALSMLETLRRQRSQLLKRHAAERMVLKEHTRDLEARRKRIRKGKNAKTERRELGKYIRQLQEEQMKKQNAERLAIEGSMKELNGNVSRRSKLHADEWEDVDDDSNDEICEKELENMFAHLTT